jgi:hypothetical protein
MTMADVCAAFGVSPSTGGAKARTISDALKLRSSLISIHA